jgi:hypothetical protein
VSPLDVLAVLFGAQARLAVWFPLGGFLAWSLLARRFGVRSPRARFWSLLALTLLAPLVFVVPLVEMAAAGSNLNEDVGRFVTIPSQGRMQGESALAFIWPFLLIPLGMLGASLLGAAEYLVACAGIWLTRRARVGDVIVLERPGLKAFTFGLVRPRVYLTRAVFEGPHLQAVLAHERAHARRRDPLVLFVARGIRRSTLYLPFGSKLLNELHLQAERACDEAGVTAVGRKRYASALLAFAEAPNARLRAPTALAFGAAELTLLAVALYPVLQWFGSRVGGGWIALRLEALLCPAGERERLLPFALAFAAVYLGIIVAT